MAQRPPGGGQPGPRPGPDDVLVFHGTVIASMSAALIDALTNDKPVRLTHGSPGIGYSFDGVPFEGITPAGRSPSMITFTPIGPLPDGEDCPEFTGPVTPQI